VIAKADAQVEPATVRRAGGGAAPTPHDSVFHRVFGVPANAASQLRAVLRIARYAYGYGAESVYRQAA
jgi:hypothetical protein